VDDVSKRSVSKDGVGTRMLDIARSLGVSVSTVSLALGGSDLVASSTRERVRSEANRLGYVYNRRAADLRKSRRNVVGLVVPDITSPFASEAALGLQNSSELLHHIVALSNTRERIDVQTEILTALIEERAMGVVLIPALGTRAKDLEPLKRSKVPTVLMNRDLPGSGLSFVGTDDAAVIEMALRHLVEVHKIRSAGYFGGLSDASPRKNRSRLFSSYLRRAGIVDDMTWNITTGPRPLAAFEAACERLRSEGPLPDAILCHSDSIAIGLLRALAIDAAGRSCAVVGIDGLISGLLTTPALTSVAVFPARMGAHAGRMLLAEAHGQEAALDSDSLAPQLIQRESCGCRLT
jgi:LacI family transcriptional regulator